MWADMENSAYTQATLDVFRRVREKRANVGLCLQAYLRRTQADLEDLLAQGAAIRLVKGAYAEPHSIAFATKADLGRTGACLRPVRRVCRQRRRGRAGLLVSRA